MDIYNCSSDRCPSHLERVCGPPSILFCINSVNYVSGDVIVSYMNAEGPSRCSVSIYAGVYASLMGSNIVLTDNLRMNVSDLTRGTTLSTNNGAVTIIPYNLLCSCPGNDRTLGGTVNRDNLMVSRCFPSRGTDELAFETEGHVLSNVDLKALVVRTNGADNTLDATNFTVSRNESVFYVPPRRLFGSSCSNIIGLVHSKTVPIFSTESILGRCCSVRTRGLGPTCVATLGDRSNVFTTRGDGPDHRGGTGSTRARRIIRRTIRPSVPSFSVSSFARSRETVFRCVSTGNIIDISRLRGRFDRLRSLISILSSLRIFNTMGPLPNRECSVWL